MDCALQDPPSTAGTDDAAVQAGDNQPSSSNDSETGAAAAAAGHVSMSRRRRSSGSRRKAGSGPVVLSPDSLLHKARDSSEAAAAAAVLEHLPAATLETAASLLSDLPSEVVPLVIAKTATRRGKGGRQPAADPHLDPTVDPKRAKRILANRISAARSKLKQKLLNEGQKLRQEVMAAKRAAAAAAAAASGAAGDADADVAAAASAAATSAAADVEQATAEKEQEVAAAATSATAAAVHPGAAAGGWQPHPAALPVSDPRATPQQRQQQPKTCGSHAGAAAAAAADSSAEFAAAAVAAGAAGGRALLSPTGRSSVGSHLSSATDLAPGAGAECEGPTLSAAAAMAEPHQPCDTRSACSSGSSAAAAGDATTMEAAGAAASFRQAGSAAWEDGGVTSSMMMPSGSRGPVAGGQLLRLTSGGRVSKPRWSRQQRQQHQHQHEWRSITAYAAGGSGTTHAPLPHAAACVSAASAQQWQQQQWQQQQQQQHQWQWQQKHGPAGFNAPDAAATWQCCQQQWHQQPGQQQHLGSAGGGLCSGSIPGFAAAGAAGVAAPGDAASMSSMVQQQLHWQQPEQALPFHGNAGWAAGCSSTSSYQAAGLHACYDAHAAAAAAAPAAEAAAAGWSAAAAGLQRQQWQQRQQQQDDAMMSQEAAAAAAGWPGYPRQAGGLPVALPPQQLQQQALYHPLAPGPHAAAYGTHSSIQHAGGDPNCFQHAQPQLRAVSYDDHCQHHSHCQPHVQLHSAPQLQCPAPGFLTSYEQSTPAHGSSSTQLAVNQDGPGAAAAAGSSGLLSHGASAGSRHNGCPGPAVLAPSAGAARLDAGTYRYKQRQQRTPPPQPPQRPEAVADVAWLKLEEASSQGGNAIAGAQIQMMPHAAAAAGGAARGTKAEATALPCVAAFEAAGLASIFHEAATPTRLLSIGCCSVFTAAAAAAAAAGDAPATAQTHQSAVAGAITAGAGDTGDGEQAGHALAMLLAPPSPCLVLFDSAGATIGDGGHDPMSCCEWLQL